MPTATVTSKGQITIPLEIRERYGIEQGTSCVFTALDDGRFEVRPKRPHAFLDYVKTLPPHQGPPTPIEAYDEAIGDYLAEDDERIMREWHSWRDRQEREQ